MKRTISITAAPIVLTLFSALAVAQSESRDLVLKQIETKRAELVALEKQFLAPSAEDRASYAEFLRQPDTGLIRLLPRELYDTEAYRKNLKSLTMRGAGAYYSFTRLTHEYGYGSDIELDSGFLSVGFAGADYGILMNIGDLRIEDVTGETPIASFISAYSPPTLEPAARLEARRFSGAGVTIDGAFYRSRVPVEVNTNFLLRSINYSGADVLVAFRLIRKDSDGSVVIVWKLLKKYPKPELARNKNEQ